MKTSKYEIHISGRNSDSLNFPVTKKVFNELIKDYQRQIEENHASFETDDNVEFYLDDIIQKQEENERLITNYLFFHDGETSVLFVKTKCKEGWHFK